VTDDARLLVQVTVPSLIIVLSTLVSRWLDERSHKEINRSLHILLNGKKLASELALAKKLKVSD
jgi:hypothetical protein